MLVLFLKAFLIGLGLSIPTGPVGVLCIKDTLNKSRLSGFVTGLGASLGDAFYTAVVVIGMGNIIGFLNNYTFVIKCIAFLFLCVLGVFTFLKKVPDHHEDFSLKSGIEAFFSSFVLVLMSPAVLISFVIAFSSLGIMNEGEILSFTEQLIIVGGVLSGSVIWWYSLSGVTHFFRGKLPGDILHKVNKFSGSILIFFAVLILFYDVLLKVFG